MDGDDVVLEGMEGEALLHSLRLYWTDGSSTGGENGVIQDSVVSQ